MSSATNGTAAPTVDPLAAFPHVPVANSMGAWLLGTVVTFLLNGLLFHQTYRYFREYYVDDRKLMKVWVTTVVFLETVLSGINLHITYFYLVQHYWDPTYLFVQKPVWGFTALPIIAALAAILSQSFFVRRVWLLAPKFRPVVGLVFILNLGNVAFFTALGIQMRKAAGFGDSLKYSWLASIGSPIQMAGDNILSLTLIYVLRESRTGTNRTGSMLEVLMAYTISTGALNCVVHILNVGFSFAWPQNFTYAALSCVLTKLYANTFLVALNTREFLTHAGNSSAILTKIEFKVVTEQTTDSYDDVHSKRSEV